MSKKSNTVLFLAIATVANILMSFVMLIGLFILYGRLIVPLLPENAISYGIPIIFIAALVLGFLIYRWVIKVLMKKVDVEKHFDPLFKPRRRSRLD